MSSFTIDDYIALSPADRTAFDDWLRSCGACPERTREVLIEGKELITIEWIVDKQGKLQYDNKLKDVLTTEIRNKIIGNPPVWKKLD